MPNNQLKINVYKEYELFFLKTRYRIQKKLQPDFPEILINDYLISLQGKFIFVHIPKTAGKSIRKSLFGITYNSYHDSIENLCKIFPKNGNDFFKFCFIRNPYDRLLSAYLYLSKGGNQSEKDKYFSKTELNRTKDFEDFVLNWLSINNIYKYVHFYPQFKFIYINNNIAVDFVGRFENIEEDFSEISNKIGIKNDLPHVNKSEHHYYKDYYSKKMLEKVSKIYEQDINLFSYKFNI